MAIINPNPSMRSFNRYFPHFHVVVVSKLLLYKENDKVRG